MARRLLWLLRVGLNLNLDVARELSGERADGRGKGKRMLL